MPTLRLSECSSSNGTAVFRLVISGLTSVSRGNEWIRVTTRYEIGFDSIYANQVSKNTITERKRVRVTSTVHGFIYNVGSISIGGMRFVRPPPRNVWISRLLVITVSTGCLPTLDSENVSDCITRLARKLITNAPCFEMSLHPEICATSEYTIFD